MPFLRAGFNARNRDTGIRAFTRALNGSVYAPAELRQFQCGDFFWYGDRPKMGTFLAWPHNVAFGEPLADAMFANPNCTEIEVMGCNIETRREGVSYAPFIATDG